MENIYMNRELSWLKFNEEYWKRRKITKCRSVNA